MIASPGDIKVNPADCTLLVPLALVCTCSPGSVKDLRFSNTVSKDIFPSWLTRPISAMVPITALCTSPPISLATPLAPLSIFLPYFLAVPLIVDEISSTSTPSNPRPFLIQEPIPFLPVKNSLIFLPISLIVSLRPSMALSTSLVILWKIPNMGLPFSSFSPTSFPKSTSYTAASALDITPARRVAGDLISAPIFFCTTSNFSPIDPALRS